MQISIHNVESIECTQEAHWQDKPNISFYVLNLKITADGKTDEVKLFSSKPMTLTNPHIEVKG